MGTHRTVRWGSYRIPKRRIRNKIEKPGYRDRYSQLCFRNGERAEYNLHGKLVWVLCADVLEERGS